MLLHAALIFRQVIELVTAQAEVGLDTTNASKYFVSFLFSLLDRLHFISVCLATLGVAFLGSGLWEVEMLCRQVRLSKLIDKLEALGLLVWVVMRTMVWVVFPILWQAIESFFPSKLPVAWSKVRLLDDRLRVPLLSDVFLLENSLRVYRLGVTRIAKLEVSRLDLLSLLYTGLFSDVLANLLSLDCWFGLVIGVLWAGSVDLAIGTGTQNFAAIGS